MGQVGCPHQKTKQKEGLGTGSCPRATDGAEPGFPEKIEMLFQNPHTYNFGFARKQDNLKNVAHLKRILLY